MKYTVTVTQSESAPPSRDAEYTAAAAPLEIFRQGFDDPDTVRKIALVINTPTRGRPAKKAKEGAQ
jgi:hypothetical protein